MRGSGETAKTHAVLKPKSLAGQLVNANFHLFTKIKPTSMAPELTILLHGAQQPLPIRMDIGGFAMILVLLLNLLFQSFKLRLLFPLSFLSYP